MLNTATQSLTCAVLLLRMWNGTECRLISSNAPQIVFQMFFFFQIIDWNIIQKYTISLSNSNQHLIFVLGMYNGKQRSFSNLKHGCLTNSNMFSFGFNKPTQNLTSVGLLLRVWKGNERCLRKKIFFKYFPFSNTALVSSEIIDQKVIQKFIILLLNSAQHLILALGMWNRQELFRLFKLKTRSSNTDLRWRGANLLLVTCMCSLLASKKCPFPFEFKLTSHSYSRNVE